MENLPGMFCFWKDWERKVVNEFTALAWSVCRATLKDLLEQHQ